MLDKILMDMFHGLHDNSILLKCMNTYLMGFEDLPTKDELTDDYVNSFEGDKNVFADVLNTLAIEAGWGIMVYKDRYIKREDVDTDKVFEIVQNAKKNYAVSWNTDDARKYVIAYLFGSCGLRMSDVEDLRVRNFDAKLSTLKLPGMALKLPPMVTAALKVIVPDQERADIFDDVQGTLNSLGISPIDARKDCIWSSMNEPNWNVIDVMNTYNIVYPYELLEQYHIPAAFK